MTVDRFHLLLGDLEEEIAELDALLAGLRPEQWTWVTESAGWAIAHQVAHLAATDHLMHLALTDEAAFRSQVAPEAASPSFTEEQWADPDLGRLELARWRGAREMLLEDFRTVGPGSRMPWVGPSMSVASAITSRIMEVWAHGEDVRRAVGREGVPTKRLRHVAHLAVLARDFAFHNRGLIPPKELFRIEISGPDDDVWTWGPETAAQRVYGDAYDFALLATRRVHRTDAGVSAIGADTEQWLNIIQAYAGPPGEGRPPRGSTADAVHTVKSVAVRDGFTSRDDALRILRNFC